MENLIALFVQPETWIALATLIALELVLGIDNLVFISILTNKIPDPVARARARQIGIGLALVLRLALLATISFIVRATDPIFILLGQGISWRDLILIGGGLFLLYKAIKEIGQQLRPEISAVGAVEAASQTFAAVIVQIIAIDLVFSLDSIITAVAMTPHVAIMVVAVITTVVMMLIAAKPLADFIAANPGVVMLALAFLVMIGVVLIADGFEHPIPKPYIYAAMAFAAAVEVLNIFARRVRRPVA